MSSSNKCHNLIRERMFLILCVVLFFLFVTFVYALDPLTGVDTSPRIQCDIPGDLTENTAYTISCRWEFTERCTAYNYSCPGGPQTCDCITGNPDYHNDYNDGNGLSEEAIYNYTFSQYNDPTHIDCIVANTTYPMTQATAQTSSQLQLGLVTPEVSMNSLCSFKVWVRTNLYALPSPYHYGTDGQYYSVIINSTIIDKNNSLNITPDVHEYNVTSGGPNAGQAIKVINSRLFEFNVSASAAACKYVYLGENGAGILGTYTYYTASLPGGACNNDAQGFASVTCGNLTINQQGTPALFTQILNYSRDANKLRYGFYCNSSTGVMGSELLEFTIDTTPPNVTIQSRNTNTTDIILKDNGGTGATFDSPGLIQSYSRALYMTFETNEDAMCRYEITNSSTRQYTYNQMSNALDLDYSLDNHTSNISFPIGSPFYMYIGCVDRYGNSDDKLQTQWLWNATSNLFMLQPPGRPTNVTAIDNGIDDGKTINISWGRSDQDGQNENYVTQYEIFRVGNTTNDTAYSGFSLATLYDMSNLSIKNIMNVTASGSDLYFIQDHPVLSNVVYYYYIVARYFNDSVAGVMDTILFNMSSFRVSNIVNATDEGVPDPVQNLSAITAMYNIVGDTLQLVWNLSADDPDAPDDETGNNSMDVTNYTIFRQIYGSVEYYQGIFDKIATISYGKTSYQDFDLDPLSTYCYKVMATDTSNLSTNSSEYCVRPNSLPYFMNISITPLNPRTDDDLTCTVLIRDLDGDDLRGNVNISWTIFHVSTYETVILNLTAACTPPIPPGPFQRWNFDEYTTECIANLSANYSVKGDKVWCSASGTDGTEQIVTVDIKQANLASSYYNASENNTYINYTKVAGYTSALWRLNQTNQGIYNTRIPSSCFGSSTNVISLLLHNETNASFFNVSYGQCFSTLWKNITKIDNIQSGKQPLINTINFTLFRPVGTTIFSSYAAINNTPPFVTNVSIVPNIPNGSSNLYCNYTFNDTDGDLENTSMTLFEWYINNEGFNEFVKILGETGQILHNRYLDQNDILMCAVKPHDIDYSWLNNPLPADQFSNSTPVTVIDNSIPQIINYSSYPFSSASDPVTLPITIVGKDVVFDVEWYDTDIYTKPLGYDEEARMYVCDNFASSESQAGDLLNTTVHFGDNTSNKPVNVTFYTNQTGRYVSKISIKASSFQRNNYFVYAADSLVGQYDADYSKSLKNFTTSNNLTFVDSDLSRTYTAGETIIQDTNGNFVYEPNRDIVLRGSMPSYYSSLLNISTHNQMYFDINTDNAYNLSVDYIYYDPDTNDTASSRSRRLEVVAMDNQSSIYFTAPIYDMYVYEVDSPGQIVTAVNTMIARDNNNIFVVGKYNHFNPQYNAQPLPNKYLAFVLCIDTNDDGACDTNNNYMNDSIYVKAEDSATGNYPVRDSSSRLLYNPEIMIDYDRGVTGGCVGKSFCNTSLSQQTKISCSYTVREEDNETQQYAVRVCDKGDACSVIRKGTFNISHIPAVKSVYLGSDSNNTAIGDDTNLMCMHTGANDELETQSDFVLDADGNWTLFGDIRNSEDDGLNNLGPLMNITNGSNVQLIQGSTTSCLTFDTTDFIDGSNRSNTTYEPYFDALVIDFNCSGNYDSASDVIIYNPFNSLRVGDNLTNISSSQHYISFHDSNNDGDYTWNSIDSSWAEDLIYNPVPKYGTNDNLIFNEDINFTFSWYVKPLNGSWMKATNFSWYDDDFNDILTHGNTMPGDQWVCEVNAMDRYGANSSMNSSVVTIGYGGVNPSLAPKIYRIWDDSNSTKPTTVGNNVNVFINYSDPDSGNVKAYICNSSRIIRNSGCFEKEFARKNESSSAGVSHIMVVSFPADSMYNMSGTNYTVMLCDPEYHCSDVITPAINSNLSFYVNHPPVHTSLSPYILPYPGNYSFPINYSETRNMICNISFNDVDDSNCNNLSSPCYDILNATFNWYVKRDGEVLRSYIGYPGWYDGHMLANGAFDSNDTLVCGATITDKYGGQSIYKESDPIVIGTVIINISDAKFAIPQIDSVVTDSRITSPKNIGDVINFQIFWHDYLYNNVTFFLCNSSNLISTGCRDMTLASEWSVTTSPTTLSYTIATSDLNFMTNSSPNLLNYTIYIVNNGAGYSNYSENVSDLLDDFAVNSKPSVSNVAANGLTDLNCSYVFTDNDILNSTYSSIFKNDSSYITWYNMTGTGSWLTYNFSAFGNRVPSFFTHIGETWRCEVTPYDGYAYGTPINSTPLILGNTAPVISDYAFFYRHSPETLITASSPLILNDLIILKVNWTDYDDASTTIYIISSPDITTAAIYSVNMSSNHTIEAQLNSSFLLNLSGNSSNWNVTTSNFTFVLLDKNWQVSPYYTDASNSIYINRRPYLSSAPVVSKVTGPGGYFDCNAVAMDDDIILDYNTTRINYSWYKNSTVSGITYYPQYNYTTIPFSMVNYNESWICQAMPCDNYACGKAYNSTPTVMASDIPSVVSVKVYNSATSSITLNSNISPVTFGNMVNFNITWDDANLAFGSETVNISVCENSSVSSTGWCINTTTWCTFLNDNDGKAACAFNTSLLNITKYNNGTVNYSVYVTDSTKKVSSNYSNVFYINRVPYVKDTNVSITPQFPTNTSPIYCNFEVSDDDNYPYYAATSSYINWYLDRGNTGYTKTVYTTATITPDLTQKLDRWICQVTPSDSYVNGTAVNSSFVTIGNFYEYSDWPNITQIFVNSNATNPTLVGNDVQFSLSWSDAQQPNEFIRVIICNSSEIINNSGCMNKSYVNLINYTKSNPAVVKYTVQDSVFNTASDAITFYAMICDSTGFCSNIVNGTFSVNHKPNVTNVVASNLTPYSSENLPNLFCNFTYGDSDSFSTATDVLVHWYIYNSSKGYCGDGYPDNSIGEQCEGNLFVRGFEKCTDYPGFTGGIVTCNLDTCIASTNLCTYSTPVGNPAYCGNNQTDLEWEQCDFPQMGLYDTCSEIGSFTGGTLSCASDCTYNISNCTGGLSAFCGNGILELNEECEYIGDNLIGDKESCKDIGGYKGGILKCGSDCKYDTSSCIGNSYFYDDLGTIGSTLPASVYKLGYEVLCSATPYDGFNFGDTVFSNTFKTIGSTPFIENAVSYYYKDASSNVYNTNITPVTYGNNITINVTWDDYERYSPVGESVRMYICNSFGSTAAGCLGKTLCSVPKVINSTNWHTVGNASSNNITCTFNTSLFNATTDTELTYHVYLWDDSQNYTNKSFKLYVNRMPNLTYYNITPQLPLDAENIVCNVTVVDNDNDTWNLFNKTYTYYKWYVKPASSNFFSEYNNAGSNTVVNGFTSLGDEWICEFVYGDSIINSSKINTSSVVIRAGNYNLTQPNISSITIRSANPYLGVYSYRESSGTPIYSYDNSTNVGYDVNITVDWSDADQLANNSEYVRLYMCNSTAFINNSGCVERTMFFADYLNMDPINFTYRASDMDQSWQNFSIVLCDDSALCSQIASDSIKVNHRPGGPLFIPEIITYPGVGSNTSIQCYYEQAYTYAGGSNDSLGLGDEINSSASSFLWYRDSGQGLTQLASASETISLILGNTDKLMCSVNITDVFGFSSGYYNSSLFDLGLLPVVWPLSDSFFEGYYVIKDKDPTNITGSTEVIGYLPTDPVANISMVAYHEYDDPYRTLVSNLNRATSLKSNTTIVASTEFNKSYIIVNRVSGITTNFVQGNYISIANQNLSYYERYYINNTAYEVQSGQYRINIIPALNKTTVVGDTVEVYSGATAKYPYGWFNSTISLYNGISTLYVRSNRSNILGSSRILKVVYDSSSPTLELINFTYPTKTYNPVVRFNITDDFFVNITSLSVNVSNGTHRIFHFMPNTTLNLSAILVGNSVRGDNIACDNISYSYYNCSVKLNLNAIYNSNDSYSMRLNVKDIVGFEDTKTVASFGVTKLTLSAPVAFAKPVQNDTFFTFGMFFNMTNVSNIEFVVGTAPYPDNGWQSIAGPTNLTGTNGEFTLQNFTELIKFVDYNYNIYYDNNETFALSSTTLLNGSSVIIKSNSIALKNFASTYKYNCTGAVFDSSCSIITNDTNNLYGTTDIILFNSSPMTLGSTLAPLTNIPNIKYFDTNNNSRYDNGEPVFNSTDNVITNISELAIPSSAPALTLHLNTSLVQDLTYNLTNDNSYRITVRYWNGSDVSPWASTNPIIYKVGYNVTEYKGPEAVYVYDKNTTHSEPGSIVDIAHSSNLSFYWTTSVPQRPEIGEYILRYEYAFGNEPWPYDGWNSLSGWVSTADNSTTNISINATLQQKLVQGEMYYLTVRALSSFGLYSANSSTNGIVYNDKTAPLITVINVAGNTTPGRVSTIVQPLTATIYSPLENLSQCGYSLFKTPFDINYVITRRCNVVDPNNQTYITCDLKDMSGNDLAKGNYTFYFACLDKNFNSNQVVGTNPTIALNLTYTYPEAPTVTNLDVKGNNSRYGQMYNEVYRDTILNCYNLTYYDPDNDPISITEYNWQKNGVDLPAYENSTTLNISKYTPFIGANYSCSVRLMDSTNRWSAQYTSENITVINSPPSAVTLLTPANGTYVTTTTTFSWNYGYDIDPDLLNYTLMIMNYTDSFMYNMIANYSTRNETNFYTFDLTQNYADGLYFWKIKTCDNTTYRNNCTNSSQIFNFVKDSTGPLINILTPDNMSTVGLEFEIAANVFDRDPSTHLYNEPSSVRVRLWNGTELVNTTMTKSNGLYRFSVDGNSLNLTDKSYNITVYASDSLGNWANQTINISINPNKPILQIDWPPWEFREQYLNHNFNLNLSAKNAAMINYTIYNATHIIKSNNTVFVQLGMLIDQPEFVYKEPVDVSNLSDGKYFINFTAVDSLGNKEFKQSWFAIDKTAPMNYSVYYDTVLYSGASEAVTFEWANNSLVPDDNMYGVKNVTLYLVATSTLTNSIFKDASSAVYTATPVIEFIDAIITTSNTKQNYTFTIPSQYVSLNAKYLYFVTCAVDYAGNNKCTQQFNLTVGNRVPVVTGLINDIIIYEIDGYNNTINLSQNLKDPDNEQVNYTGILLPKGVLLYDPLDDVRKTRALQGNTSGTLTWKDNVIYRNATLVEIAHYNLLGDGGFENYTLYNDSNGIIRLASSSKWTLVNNASTSNISGQYYNGLYGARVSGENYFYQKVIVQQSTNYTLSQYMKSESGNINGRLHINWYDSSGNYISSTLNLSDNTSRPQLDTTWKRYNITVKSPANAWQAWIYADTDSNESYAYVDNILFEESNYITAYSPFDHATGYLRYPKQPTYNGNSSIRQNINASAGTLEVSIMPTWDGTDARERYLFDASGQAKFYANINQSINMTLLNFVYGSYNVSYNISGWKDGGIYRLAFLWDNNTIAIYVNGTNYRQMALGGYKLVNSNLSNNIYIGSRNDSTKQIDAFLDELIIYDYFKSTSEIEQDNNTIPVGKLDNYDSTNYNLILFNMSINNVASASNFSIPNITIDPDKYKPSSTYHQRVQFFAEDVADYIASNVVDIHVISDNNFYGTNVTLFNSSICTGGAPVCNDIGYNLSNMSDASDADGAANNITSSFIYNSILENTTAGTFGIGSSTLNFTLVNSSFVSGTTAYMSVINYSNVSGISTFTNSNISNSIVINSTLINSSIANHSIVVNSLILNSILENVNLSNAVIDPTIIVRVSGVNFTINDSNTLMDVKVNHSTIVNATSILNSNITYCKISTVENHGVRSNYNISDALLQGDRNNTDLCRLLNGSLTVIQNTTTDGVIYNTATYPFIFYTATHTAQPLIKDIWNYTPIVTLVSATGSPLTNYSSITFPYLTFNVSIVDPNINSTIMDYVNVTWDVWGTDKDGYPIHLLDKTITNLNQTNISDANNKTSKNETITNINISIIVTDRFGNKVSQSLKGLNYSYAVALPPATVYLNCSLNGTNVTHGQSATFYSVTNSTSCSSSGLSRTCNNGTLSGSNLYNYSSCTTITDPGSGGGGGGGGKSYCYNGKRDFTKGETGIDCGGICGSCYKLCNDSKLNGQESQTDCGGVCKSCPVPPISGGATTSLTCYNGKKDSNEEDVDCGGACKKSCAVPTPTPTSTATCVDGVQNQGEWAVDCGGPCPACQQQQQPVDLPEPTFANWIPWFILIFVVLFALIVLWIIIVSDKNKYKRIEEHERTIEKKLEHEEELIASMGANLGDRINASIANISNASQQISAVSNGQNIAGMTTAGLYAQQDAESRGPISDSIINLEKYIIACLDAGFMPSKIRQSLDTVSWSPVVVDVVIHKIMLSGDKLEEVEKYISKQIRKGMTDEQIAEKLASEHWSKEIVDLIISDVHKITHNNQNLKSYVEKKLKEGKTLDEIHQILVSIGWNERYIQKIFNKHFDNKRS